MLLTLTGKPFRFECENLCRLFFPYSRARVEQGEPAPGEPWACCSVTPEKGEWRYAVRVSDGEQVLEREETRPALEEYGITDLLYRALEELTGYSPAWGMLTGVHPVKLLRQYTQELGEPAALGRFQARCHVSPAKAELAARVLRAQQPAVDAAAPRDFCLYVGIPFCPTRCSYCSFVSQDVEGAGELIDPYFEHLLEEIRETGRIAREARLRLVSVYVGGGTPTTLSAWQLARLCAGVEESFDLSACGEFTVEAGRPDTITAEKLAALREHGVGRISINPQSLSDRVLENIGRRHSAADVYRAFALAKEAGFAQINADLIVGLPGDDLEGFSRSLEGVLSLGAANITVHSLALKRAARLVTEGGDLSLHRRGEETAAMVDLSIRRLTEAGLEPYYLYRQTRMAGNLENTGWARPGTVCRYNIYTMDESLTVLACGAGGVSKLKDPFAERLERVFNFKLPLEYLRRFDEVLERKQTALRFYQSVEG